jgi:alpha-beta hydrolase superfamily lysophospholipase
MTRWGRNLPIGSGLAVAIGLGVAVGCAAPGMAPTETPVATPVPSHTPSPVPSLAPSPTSSVTPSLTPTLNPLTIESMRQRDYPGSPIAIEETLPAGGNYSRYIASYISEGNKIYGLLTVPYGDPPATGWPVIIFNHGYIPPDIYQTTSRYVAYVDAIARHGYIVFKPDYRGHGNSEGAPSGAYGSPDYVVDVINATVSMENYPGADRNRVGMWGHSMGGYITLRAMVIRPDIKVGVIWAGVVASYPDLISLWHRTPAAPGTPSPMPRNSRGWRGALSSIYGTPSENPAFWDSISANAYLQDLSGPLQLHHGTADHEVPLIFSQKLYDQIQAAGGTVELYIYPGADHNLAEPFSLAMQRTLTFFDRYLKPE